MPFQYSCFISYRHGQKELMERFINDLCDALSNEVVPLTDLEIYVDKKRLTGGVFFNSALSQALCESVCLIMVYTPTYLSEEHTYCAREYKAMEKLEKERINMLSDSEQKQYGLIIPIVLRGEKTLPVEIKANRQYYDFTKFKLRDTELKKNPNYDSKIQEIADYIHERFLVFNSLSSDPCDDCSDFEFPTDSDIAPWLKNVIAPRKPFPNREENQ